jgi:hypothetical protein
MFSNLLAKALARRGIHYGWAMVEVTFLTMLSTSAVMGMPGVLLAPLRQSSAGTRPRFPARCLCGWCCMAWSPRSQRR